MSVSKRKIIVVSVIIVIIAIALYFIFKKPAVKKDTITTLDPIIFPLKKGSSGSGVVAVQKYLNEKYNAGLSPDGEWGPITDAAALAHLKRDNVSKDSFEKWGLSKYIP